MIPMRNRDEEDWNALLPDQQPPDPNAPPQPLADVPAPEPPPDAEQSPAPQAATPSPDDDWSSLLGPYQQPAVSPDDVPPPPMKEKPSEGPAILGTVLDVLLNKGRQVPQMIAQFGQPEDIDYENWKRQLAYGKARAGVGGRGSASPQSLAMRRAELMMRSRALKNAEAGTGLRAAAQKTRETAQARELDTEDPRTKTTREYLYAHGAEPNTLEGLDYKALQQLMPSVRQDVTTREGSPLEQQDVTHAARKAGATSHATVGDRIAVAEAAANIAEERQRQENTDLSQITGWDRAPNAPELKPVEAEGLRKTDAAAQQYRDALQRLKDANAKLGAGDYTQSTLLGKHTPAMAAAIAAHSNVLTKQRVLENLGTPQAAELKMVNKQVPAPDSFGGVMNGDAAYGAMLNEYGQNHEAMMNKYGYVRHAAPAVDVPGNLGVTSGAGPKVSHVVTPHAKKKTAKQLAAEGWE